MTQDEARFWSKVDKSESCWVWNAFRNEHGYGQFRFNGGMKLAHRVAYELFYGPISSGLAIDHVCHNPSCVRPDHLREVTNKQNGENRAGAQANSRTGVRGVSPKGNRFVAQVKHRGKVYYCGAFIDIASAARAATEMRNQLFTHNGTDRRKGE
ncbi:HNH endonuclease signature motif containing protein [Arthrobacter woluwensis]|uniref:HNH endonuclease n=1 Tax=Arthrobacter woluwensis TaxID=156980 RepID=A0A1H4I5I4_9MICC|nr:HNH endonuclease signature motif containing protein [Arthrobacter woluwensis]SEB29036.1 HNH endonuclease [Arthrobacter woluwensis]SEC53589.1 HNH endonuclease [Arthrobacter woluwensis]SEC90062.1 HNH endonuclease [Arthrobacter woluwensis]SEC95589.1 HNH endonuclease [Arthrobacter woluwensis]